MLVKIPLRNQSRAEWVADREKYIGGSDVGVIYGWSDFICNIELFYQKLGESPLGEDNRFSFMGRYMEDVIADLFKYWDGDTESIVRNHTMGVKVREVRRTNFRYTDDRWPWLSCNLDRFYKEPDRTGIIDCKNMMEWVEKKWELGIPHYHVTQVMTYMGVLGMSHAYVVVLVGGNRMEAYPIEFSKEIFDGIVDRTHDFWQRLEAARKVKAETGATGNELIAMLSYMGIEPEPILGDAYEEYLKKRYTMEEGMRIGSDADMNNAILLAETKEQKKLIEAREVDLSCLIRQSIGPAQGLEFPGTKSKITCNPDKNGKRTLRLYLQ